MSDDEGRGADGRFTAGNPGGGRKPGSRNKLGEDFVTDLAEDWATNGKGVIARVRADKPDVYLRVIASLLPKEMNVRISELEALSDEDLDGRITAIVRAIALEVGTGEGAAGEEAPARPH